MTRLEANMRNLLAVDGWWHFQFSKCDSIKETVRELKDRIPEAQREYSRDGNGWQWRVLTNKKNWVTLTHVFDNFPILEEALLVAERQKGKK